MHHNYTYIIIVCVLFTQSSWCAYNNMYMLIIYIYIILFAIDSKCQNASAVAYPRTLGGGWRVVCRESIVVCVYIYMCVYAWRRTYYIIYFIWIQNKHHHDAHTLYAGVRECDVYTVWWRTSSGLRWWSGGVKNGGEKTMYARKSIFLPFFFFLTDRRCRLYTHTQTH